MQEIKYVKINSFRQKDVADLFKEICDIIKSDPVDIITKMHGIKDRRDARKREILLSDVASLLEATKLKFELKVSYLDNLAESTEVPPELNVTQKEDLEDKITNPEITKTPEVTPAPVKSEDQIPDFD